ncbi:coiled-coil domain-containing protein 115 [Cucurbita moschata]|uniref:Vacuolar ATPase assembly protein VMA22 n=2 Tax=Cucurbita TaxID=3660 RepID=A0A6J1FL58_CUCMO
MKEIQDPSLDSLNESGEEDGIEETQQEQQKQKRQERESILLQFLDSTDDYLNLLDALSSTLRQGWFDLASARHSMGTSRVSTALLDLKIHSAATSLRVEERDGGSIGTQPFINLRKWTSTEGGECLVEDKYNDKLERKSDNPQLRQRNISELSEDDLGRSSTKKEDALIIDDQVQKERSQTLSMFGTLVSPKLRSAQLSFENALEIIVEIANKRLAMSSSFDQVKKGLDDASSFEQVKEEL